MAKKALTFLKKDILRIPYEKNGVDHHFDEYLDEGDETKITRLVDLPFELRTREKSDPDCCEVDQTRLQLLPYITLRDIHTGKIFVYTRGGSGDENRLHAKCSIGVGGHIEEDLTTCNSLKEIIIKNITAELSEEVGYWTPHLQMYLNEAIEGYDYNLIYTERDEVAKVHLCMWITLPVELDEMGSLEKDIITNGEWMSLDELRNSDKFARLEEWSAICLEQLFIEESYED